MIPLQSNGSGLDSLIVALLVANDIIRLVVRTSNLRSCVEGSRECAGACVDKLVSFT